VVVTEFKTDQLRKFRPSHRNFKVTSTQH